MEGKFLVSCGWGISMDGYGDGQTMKGPTNDLVSCAFDSVGD